MAKALFQSLQRASSLLKPSSSSLKHFSLRPILRAQESVVSLFRPKVSPNSQIFLWGFRDLSYGSVNLVMSEGKPKFELHEIDPPKKNKWKTKKRLKMQRKKEKQKRKAANKRDPRRLTVKRRKNQKYANIEERIKDKLERARMKEALLIEKLKRYEVPKVQGPEVKPHDLTGEERFYLKKMAQRRSNYVPVGRRGIFGGVILNMHMHWKKHETVKVIFKPCKPAQIHEYAQEIARLSGGCPVQILGDDTVIFYRGKDYVQPEVMSPVDTLSKKRVGISAFQSVYCPVFLLLHNILLVCAIVGVHQNCIDCLKPNMS
uniref:Putative CRM domain-containing protein At3g25440ic n=1 Tax=Rhizophora mucronata TaxID=61149 RepID=A0A2P2K3K2_RHIMU